MGLQCDTMWESYVTQIYDSHVSFNCALRDTDTTFVEFLTMQYVAQVWRRVFRNHPDTEDDRDSGQDPGERTASEAGDLSQPGEQHQQWRVRKSNQIYLYRMSQTDSRMFTINTTDVKIKFRKITSPFTSLDRA